MSSASIEPTLCRIDHSLGHDRICPGEPCPFWETRAGMSVGGCVFEGVDFSGRDDLVRWLADLREAIATGAYGSDDEARRRFYERLNAGRSD